MKKAIGLLTGFIIFVCTSYSCFAAIPAKVRIGLYFGDTSLPNAVVSSGTGFNVKANSSSEKWIAELTNSSIYIESASSTYLVVEMSNFPSKEDCLKYIYSGSPECVPFYHNGCFHAVRQNLYSYAEAEAKLEEVLKINPSAYIINPMSSSIRLSDAISKETAFIYSGANGRLGLEAKDYSPLTLNRSSSYRGMLEFIANSGSFTVISYLPVEEYLYGVVPCEIGGSAPIEAQKAQAICARTYTAASMGKHASEGFDLCASQDCQVYGGLSRETVQANKAVDETRGKAAYYNGAPIKAVYSAQCGGKTADSINVWNTEYPYLKSVDDEYCTGQSWESSISFDSLTAKTAKYGLGKVIGFNILKASDDGSVTKIEIIGEKQTRTFENEEVRNILNVKSQYFEFENAVQTKTITLTPDNENKEIKPYPYARPAPNLQAIMNSLIIANPIELTSVVSVVDKTVICGHGFGHRVGLCQTGAINYAKHGMDCDSILKHYYKGIEIY